MTSLTHLGLAIVFVLAFFLGGLFAVMGCIVNGPGESKHANIGISLPGTGESPAAPVFVDGEKTVTLRGEHIAEEFQAIVLDYVKTRYGKVASTI